MRNLSITYGPARAIETEICDVMLSARVEASADLDVQIFHGLIQGEQFVGEAGANFASKASRGSDTEFARVRPRAGCDVNNRSGPRFGQANSGELAIQIHQVGFGHPAKYDVLFYRRADVIATKAACNFRQLPRLPC